MNHGLWVGLYVRPDGLIGNWCVRYLPQRDTVAFPWKIDYKVDMPRSVRDTATATTSEPQPPDKPRLLAGQGFRTTHLPA